MEWQDSISADLTTVEQLPHDDSYSEVINGYVALLESLQDFVNYIQIGNVEQARAAHSEHSALLSELHAIFAAALEKNGVEHTLDEKGLSFIYYLY